MERVLSFILRTDGHVCLTIVAVNGDYSTQTVRAIKMPLHYLIFLTQLAARVDFGDTPSFGHISAVSAKQVGLPSLSCLPYSPTRRVALTLMPLAFRISPQVVGNPPPRIYSVGGYLGPGPGLDLIHTPKGARPRIQM